jgi:hypothetical protein
MTGYHVTTTTGEANGQRAYGVHILFEDNGQYTELVRIQCELPEQDRIAGELRGLLARLLK